MSKQTAVEWLVKEFSERLGPIKTGDMQHLLLVDAIDKAKQMEKEQILEFTRNAVRKILDEDRQNPFNLEQYYNETYGDK